MELTPGLVVLAIAGYCLAIVITILAIKQSNQDKYSQPAAAPASAEGQSTKYLKDRCILLEQREVQRKLYLDLARILSTVTTFDDLASKSIDAICKALEATHGAFLWKPQHGQHLEFKYRKGYPALDDFHLPVTASIAGMSLLRKEPFFDDKPEANIQYVKIPSAIEANVLCMPLQMFNDFRGVIRVANINTKTISPSELISASIAIAPMLASALEKILVFQENERRKNTLAAVTGIAQTLQRTLELPEICAACARFLKPIFNYNYLAIVRIGEDDTITPILAIPREIRFSESTAASRIMLRNLVAKKQPLLIEDLWMTELVKCENRELLSLISIPLYLNGTPFAAIAMTSGRGNDYSQDDMNSLVILGEQISITIERALYFKKQEDQALKDGLTGLFNHRTFQDRLKLELQRFHRYKRPFSLAIIDIDHFKKFNDTYGHQTGDVVLRTVAECVRTTIRSTDVAFRYGGEEFCVLLPETDVDQATIFAVRLAAQIRNKQVQTQSGALSVTVSMGVAQSSEDSNSPNILVDAADKSLYHAKNSGRNRVCIYKDGKMTIHA
jgi:diguanylate cyclase (GGDEF)-like protein